MGLKWAFRTHENSLVVITAHQKLIYFDLLLNLVYICGWDIRYFESNEWSLIALTLPTYYFQMVVPRKDPIPRQSSSSEQTVMVETPGATGHRKSLNCFNFTGRQPLQAVVPNIVSRLPMVRKIVYNQYMDMLRQYINTSTSPWQINEL